MILLSALLAFVSERPAPEERLFTSQAVEATIDDGKLDLLNSL